MNFKWRISLRRLPLNEELAVNVELLHRRWFFDRCVGSQIVFFENPNDIRNSVKKAKFDILVKFIKGQLCADQICKDTPNVYPVTRDEIDKATLSLQNTSQQRLSLVY